MDQLPAALRALDAWPQFITWGVTPDPQKPGKFKKFPCFWRTGEMIDAHNPAYWTNFEVASAFAALADRGHGSGVGFVITDNDPFYLLDIDGAWDDRKQQWSQVAMDICGRLAGAALEVSMSGTGLHSLGMTAKPLTHAKKNTPLGLELYTRARFVALTGVQAQGDVGRDMTAPLAGIIAQYFQPTATGDAVGWTTEPVPEWTGPAEDDELIARAVATTSRSAAAVFEGRVGVTFADLWTANVDVLGRAWPPNKHAVGYDQSGADMALANHLAFWTGKNCERMATLMLRSALNRDKWHTRPTYLADTITQACAFTQKVYTHKAAAQLAPPTPTADVIAATAQGARIRDMNTETMPALQQQEYFAGCHYDRSTGMVYSTRHNRVYNKAVFDVEFGGHRFVLDHFGRSPTKSAWEALTLSLVNFAPMVDALIFRPELGAGELVSEGAYIYCNSYAPHTPRLVRGDVSLFLQHMAKLLPDEDDRNKLISYMAACAQNPGKKFQWWPVLQGVEGNGKTILITIMTHVFGQQYVHLPNTAKLGRGGMNFNSWLYRKLFVGMEEIMAANRRDLLEEIKPMITNSRLEIEGKGSNQFMGDNRANGMMMTNHRNGIPITTDSRRYAVFYTAQQTEEDLFRDGMGAAYFKTLFDWLEGDGYACIAQYLLDYAIPVETMASLMYRAPATTSTEEALVASYGPAEQAVMDAVEEGRPGFAGGWVSGFYLEEMLKQNRLVLSHQRRDALMRSLGYVVHHLLANGRPNNPVMPDNRRPKLYLRKGHAALSMTVSSDIAAAYSRANDPVLKGVDGNVTPLHNTGHDTASRI